MKLKIAGQPEEKEIFIKLTPSFADNEIDVDVLNTNGERLATIARISSKGIHRLAFVDPSIGFALESSGRIKDI